MYEVFVKNHPSGTFFQSWAFGEFQEKIPYRGKSWTLLVEGRGSRVEASCLVIKMKLRLGKCWLWVPYGPLGFSEEIFEDLARIAKEEKAIFARIEPPGDFPFLPGEKKVAPFGRIVKSPERFTPEHSLVLDLEKSEDEILAQMKPKGRYNIQIGVRHGVLVHRYGSDASEKDFVAFYEILKKTAGRDSFSTHPKFFYKTLLETFGAEGANLFLAYSPEKKVIGGIIVIYYKDTATYYYGASDYAHRNLMAPYLLQWEAIREAKRRGIKHYDFLGIAPPHAKKHPYAGITEFKKKFGGREITHPPAFDVVYRPFLYRAIRLVQSYRR